MNGRRIIAAGNAIALVLLLIAIVTPVRAESGAERISRLQTELEWVAGVLRTIDLYDDLEDRERLEKEVERLEQERLKLLRVMPEQVDPEKLLEQLTRLAASEDLELTANEPKTIDHGDYSTVTVRVKLEGSGDAQRFVRRLRSSQGVKRVTEVEGDGTVRLFDVNAFMIPPSTVALRSCSITEGSHDASERESMLRERLISRCAALDAADPKVRTAIHRRQQLMDWIDITARLVRESLVSVGHIPSVAEIDFEFDEEVPADVAAILEEPKPALKKETSAPLEPVVDSRSETEIDYDEKVPADVAAILEEPKPPLEERMKWADARADMRWIATAAEAYQVDHDRYPETSDIAQLANTLADYVSDVVGALARTDPWGKPYRWISDGRVYRIVSGGWDGTIEETSLVLSNEIHQNDDFVYQNGVFRQAPRR